jgi:hypothetical protein
MVETFLHVLDTGATVLGGVICEMHEDAPEWNNSTSTNTTTTTVV